MNFRSLQANNISVSDLYFRRECLCCFQHIDFVTAICFHPRNDQFFLSGSLDGKLRLWNIPDKKVALWNEVEGSAKLITTANFIQVSQVFVCWKRKYYPTQGNTMVPVSTVQPSLNEAVGLQIFFHHSDILSCITFYIK